MKTLKRGSTRSGVGVMVNRACHHVGDSLLRFVCHVIFPEQMISFVTWSQGRRCADTTLYRRIRRSVKSEHRPVCDTSYGHHPWDREYSSPLLFVPPPILDYPVITQATSLRPANISRESSTTAPQ